MGPRKGKASKMKGRYPALGRAPGLLLSEAMLDLPMLLTLSFAQSFPRSNKLFSPVTGWHGLLREQLLSGRSVLRR